MLIVIFFLNLGISWLNGWGCGKTWNETKANGGMPHFLNWCGAVMSAAGFTWCYLVLGGCAGASIPFEHAVHGHKVVAPYLDAKDLKLFAELGYLVIIGPILGSGIAITLHSWGVMWRERTFGATATSAWNTFAMAENVYDAYTMVPKASGDVWKAFTKSDSDSKNGWILVLVVACLLAGVLTTRWIVRSTAEATARQRGFEEAVRRG